MGRSTGTSPRCHGSGRTGLGPRPVMGSCRETKTRTKLLTHLGVPSSPGTNPGRDLLEYLPVCPTKTVCQGFDSGSDREGGLQGWVLDRRT